MSFYSVAFFCFVLFCIIIHELAGRFVPKRQWMVRLAASLAYVLYLTGTRIVFVIASAVSIWLGGLIISKNAQKDKEYRKREGITSEEKKAIKAKNRRIRKSYVAAVVVFNLVILLVTKYLFPVIGHPVALPIGISFYTLQAVSYIVDVYGGKYEAEHDPLKLMLYLSWFPQLVQGPINRFDNVREGLFGSFRSDASAFRLAAYLFLYGAVKKYVIADLLSPFVTSALNNDSASFPGSFLLFGALMFAVEQYADFSGGIDMCMAVSRLFGVTMDENFRQPYFSTSLAQFWRRWHITLGSFMRDYVFYPFVTTKPVSKLNKVISSRLGNHAGRAVIGGISNIIVFALVGLWHGPEKHYLMWGLYNGVIIAVSDACAPAFLRINHALHIPDDSRGMYVFRVFRTFMLIVFAGYFDVIGPVRTGLACFVNTFTRFNVAEGGHMISQLFADDIVSVQSAITAAIGTVIVIIISVMRERGFAPLTTVSCKKFYARWAIFFCLLILMLYSFTVSSGVRGFMYAAF